MDNQESDSLEREVENTDLPMFDISDLSNPLHENVEDANVETLDAEDGDVRELELELPDELLEVHPETQPQIVNPEPMNITPKKPPTPVGFAVRNCERADGDDLTKERCILLKKIELYYSNFPDELEGVRRPRGLNKASNKELADFCQKLDSIVSGGATSDLCKSAYLSVIGMAEHIGCAKTPLKLQGWSRAVESNPYIDKQLKRIQIKYANELETVSEPESSLLAATILTGLAVHRANSSAEHTAKVLDTRVPDELAEKYKDL